MNTKAKLPLVSHQFTYQDKPLRMLQETRETWFVAADICTALGLPQVSRAVRRIDPAYRKLMKVSLLGQPKRRVSMNVVSPAGLEQLTLLADRQPARSLRRWLRREVAPVQQWCKDDPYAAAGLPEPKASATAATGEEVDKGNHPPSISCDAGGGNGFRRTTRGRLTRGRTRPEAQSTADTKAGSCRTGTARSEQSVEPAGTGRP